MKFLITSVSGDIEDTEREITSIDQIIRLSEIHKDGIVMRKNETSDNNAPTHEIIIYDGYLE